MKQFAVLMLGLTVCVACSDDDDVEAYPSLVTCMADAETNGVGTLTALTTDDGTRYQLANPVSGYTPNVWYRVVAGYELQADGMVTLYTLDPVWRLRDSAAVLRHDPAGVTSVWRGGKYINMQLTTMTQGGTQYWGFATDSVTGEHTHHVSLHHNQNGDSQAYTTTVYASLPIDSIRGAVQGDTLQLTIHTPTPKCWTFIY